MVQNWVQWRERFVALRSNRAFEFFVIAIIILSALEVGAKTYDLPPSYDTFFAMLDTLVTLIFLAELLIRMAAEERLRHFFRQGWNIFDFVIVTVSLIPVDESQMALLARLLRIFRVLRLVAIIPELRVMMNALLLAIPRMGYVLLLMFIIFYIYAAIGCALFAAINPDLWGNISLSLLTLFRIATFEGWSEVMYETMAVYPFSWSFYLTFIFFAAFVFLNMMVGIVLEVMQSEHEKYNREQGAGAAGDVQWIREHTGSIEERLARMEQMLKRIEERR